MPFGVVRGGVNLHHAEHADHQADDQQGPIEVAKTAVLVDFQTKSTYDLKLVLIDQGAKTKLSTTTSLTIKVLDANEFTPVFVETILQLDPVFNVTDSIIRARPMGRLSATDADGPSDRLTFYVQEDSTEIMSSFVEVDSFDRRSLPISVDFYRTSRAAKSLY